MALDFRPFNANDWSAFAGAEGEPVIAFAGDDRFAVIVDAVGLGVYGVVDGGDPAGWQLPGLTQKGAAALLRNGLWTSHARCLALELESLGLSRAL